MLDDLYPETGPDLLSVLGRTPGAMIYLLHPSFHSNQSSIHILYFSFLFFIPISHSRTFIIFHFFQSVYSPLVIRITHSKFPINHPYPSHNFLSCIFQLDLHFYSYHFILSVLILVLFNLYISTFCTCSFLIYNTKWSVLTSLLQNQIRVKSLI